MLKRKLKLISFLTAALMVSSSLNFIKASATENGLEKLNLTGQMEMYNSQLVNTKARQAYLEELKTNELKQPIQDENRRDKEKKLDPEQSVRLIVETSGKSISDSVSGNKEITQAAKNVNMKNQILETQNELKQNIKKINNDVKYLNYFYVFSNAFSLETKAKDIEKIRQLDGVKKVTIANEYYPEMNSAVKITKASDVWESKKLKGEGVVVAIIDTGIDVTHKDMKVSEPTKNKIHKDDIGTTYSTGKGEFFTDKVPYGYNFADQNKEVKDATSSMHGMHVAGIVAANASDSEVQANTGVKGTAPEAQLLAMKVFSNNPNYQSAFSDNIAAAIEDSVAHGADVINMSLGASAGFVDPKDIEQMAIQKATESGTVCVVSAGNSQYSTAPNKFSGMPDTGIVGSPATATDSMMVASYENDKITGFKFDYTSSKESGSFYYGFNESEPNPITTLNIASGYAIENCGKGTIDDFKSKNLTGKIALVQRGDIPFLEKKLNAQSAGAEAIIIYNNRPGLIGGMASDNTIKIPALSITQTEGTKLLSLADSNLKLIFKDSLTILNNTAAKDMSSFTSWGPTPNLMLRPYLSAPGGMINSTVNNNKYENMSGTSMAAPHASGLTALVLQYMSKSDEFKNLKEREKVEVAKNLLVNTAVVSIDPLTGSTQLPFSPRRQGAGLANVDDAVKSTVVASFSGTNEPVASLKDIKDAKTAKDFSIKLKNYGKTPVVYNVKDISGVMTEQPKSIGTMSFDVLAKGASLNIKDPKVTVPANGEKIVSFSLSVTEDTPKNGFLEGFIKFESENEKTPSLGIPYLAFNGDWSEPNIIEQPNWVNGDNIWGKTMVATIIDGKIYPLAAEGKDAKGNLIFNQDNIAFNPELGYQNNAVPLLSLVRNAKTVTVDIENDKGKIIRTIATSENLNKSYGTRTFSRVDNWLWDGKVYNAATGEYVSAPEGQYKIKISAKIDYENAITQTMTMPVKIDKTNSQITDVSYNEVRAGVFNIKYKAMDNLSGISGFGLMVDTPDKMYKFNGKSIEKLTPDKDGYYNMEVNLGESNHTLTLLAYDNGGNVGLNTFQVSNVQITSPENGKKYQTGDFDINFVTNDKVKNSITGYEILISKDNGKTIEKVADLDKFQTSYRVRHLEPGKYIFAVYAIAKNGKENSGYISSTSVEIKATKMNLVVTSPQPSSNYTQTSTINIGGTVDVVPNIFTIGGIKMKPIKTTVNVLDEEGNPTGVEKNTFAFTGVLDNTKLVRGINKIPVYAEYKDSFGTIIDKADYSIDIYYEDKMPELTISNNLIARGTNLYDYVDLKDTTYVVRGTALSYLEGYDLYINGEHKLSALQGGTINDENNQTKKTFEIPVNLVDKDPKVEVKLVSKSGLEVKKVITVRRMDYPAYGLCLDPVVRDGITVTNSIFTVGGKVNPNMKNMILKINDKVVNLSASTDIFALSVALKPGVNPIEIKANFDGKNDVIIKTINVNYTEVKKSTPKFDFTVGSIHEDGKLGVTLLRSDKIFKIKGKASDDLAGFKVELVLLDAQGYTIAAADRILLKKADVAGEVLIDSEVPVTENLSAYRVFVTNDFGNSVTRTLTVNLADDFMKNQNILFSKPLYDGMKVNKNSMRFEGSLVSKLAVFNINGIEVKIAPDASFNTIIPLSEGMNTVTVETALAVTPNIVSKATIKDVLSDTKAPVINVSSPTENSVIVDAKTNVYTIKGMVNELNSPAIFVNGNPVKLNTNNEFAADVTLVDGVNVIKLSAQDVVSNMSEKIITINKNSTKTATINGINIDGKPLLSFNPNVYEYIQVLDVKAKTVPIIEAIKAPESNVAVKYSNAVQLPGTSTIEVTGEDGITKLTYKINFVRSTEVTLLNVKNNGLGGDSVYSATVKNNQNKSQKSSLILALYNDQGKLMNYVSVSKELAAGETSALTGTIKLPEIGKFSVRAMVWDSIENMNSLTDYVLSETTVSTDLIDISKSSAKQLLGMNVVSISTLKDVQSVIVNGINARKELNGKWIVPNLLNVKLGDILTVTAMMASGETQTVKLTLKEN